MGTPKKWSLILKHLPFPSQICFKGTVAQTYHAGYLKGWYQEDYS
jgi:hypothetical protein